MLRLPIGETIGVFVFAVTLPFSALAKDDCLKRSEWKPITTYAPERVKVKISVKNRTSAVVTSVIDWTDNYGENQPSIQLAMVEGQTGSHTFIVKGRDGVPNFATNISDYGTANFSINFQNKSESRFKPGDFPAGVKCDRDFGNNDNIWKIHYVVG